MSIVYFLICVGASILGGITGMGGGVIIKPVLDAFGTMDVTTISFLSGCTVLVMSLTTLYSNRKSDVKVDKGQGTWLAVGAAIGGIIGKQIFDMIKVATGNPELLGMLQSFGLAGVTLLVLIFTLHKHKITTYQLTKSWLAAVIGIVLGTVSAFLGIGGGPINLAVLYLFFSMDTRTAALNSIYIICFSQVSSFLHTVALGNVPEFEWSVTLMMLVGGVLGGVLATNISNKLSMKGLDKAYIGVVICIISMSIANGFRYMSIL